MLKNEFLPGTLAAAVARRHGRGAGRHPVVIVDSVAVWTAGEICRCKDNVLLNQSEFLALPRRDVLL